jgi:energy-converting hydrogenase Eha subunit G
VIVGGGCEDVAWGHTGDGLVGGVLVATRLLRFRLRRRTSPRQVAWSMTRKTSGMALSTWVLPRAFRR